MDLSSVGKNFVGPVWDCYIQEIDIETEELVFQWSALDHIKLSATYREIGKDGENGIAWDWFHINSIDKDAKGNYLVSSRYLHALFYVDGKTGDLIWTLGGKGNQFLDLSDGHATNFAYQHDARWRSNDTISMFDNAIDDKHIDNGMTRGLKLRLDTKNMTVAVDTEYFNPHWIKAKSQGSFQELPNGNVLVGYGDTAAFTEFAANGYPLCDVHFQPELQFLKGQIMSYRVIKNEWKGFPFNSPTSMIAEDGDREWKIFVSWNGATEVARWVVEGAKLPDNYNHTVVPDLNTTVWKEYDSKRKIEFEEALDLKPHYPAWLRVVAKDSQGQVLGYGAPLNCSDAETVSYLACPACPPPPTIGPVHNLLRLPKQTSIHVPTRFAGDRLCVTCAQTSTVPPSLKA